MPGIGESAAAANRERIPILSERQVAELTALASRIEEQFGEPVPLLDRELIENWVAKQSPRIYILASDRVHERNLTALYGAAETALYARAHARGPDGEAFYKEASNG